MAFTPEQQAVIDTKEKDILVAAAAGSGKTTVLVERIIKKVLEGGTDFKPIGGKTVHAQEYEQRTYTEEELASLAEDPILKALEAKHEQ